jgi:putative endonuclease
MDARRQFGMGGEEKASRLLKDKGYCILDRNYRRKGGEVDIVCEKEGIVVFVEVKRRKTDLFGEPFEAVDGRKRRRIARSARRWLYEKKLLDKCDVRFDVVSIIQRDGREEIAHIEDAFRP